MQEVHVLGAAVHLAFTTDRQGISLRLDLHFLGINSRKRDTAVVLLAVLIHIGLDGGSE